MSSDINPTKIKNTLTFKVYLIVISSIAFCALLIGTYYYVESKALIRDEMGRDLKKKAQSVALQIDGNRIDKMESFQEPLEKKLFLLMLSENEVAVPANIFKRKSSSLAYLVLTSEPGNLFGSEFRINPTMREVFSTGKSAYSSIYTDRNGTWISAYSPIKDMASSIIGLLELNYEIGHYIRALKIRLLGIVLLCFCGCFAGIFLGIPLLRPILSSIKSISKSAHEIERGNYDEDIKAESSDEIGQLAKDLDNMRLSFKRYIQQLKDAQDELVRSEKLAAIGKIAGMISHELRNPLGVMSNSIYFIKSKSDNIKDEKIKRHLDILEKEVFNAESIISDILAFGRPKEPIFADTNIADIIKMAVNKLGPAKDIEIITKFEDALINIPADGNQLCQVFYNIILNAAQAMPEGGRIMIEGNKSQEYIEVHISDTGVGIPKENLKKIFDPLFSTKPKGTGLGMSVCQGIIERHKGSLVVESEVGKGTRFTVKLPVRREG